MRKDTKNFRTVEILFTFLSEILAFYATFHQIVHLEVSQGVPERFPPLTLRNTLAQNFDGAISAS